MGKTRRNQLLLLLFFGFFIVLGFLVYYLLGGLVYYRRIYKIEFGNNLLLKREISRIEEKLESMNAKHLNFKQDVKSTDIGSCLIENAANGKRLDSVYNYALKLKKENDIFKVGSKTIVDGLECIEICDVV